MLKYLHLLSKHQGKWLNNIGLQRSYGAKHLHLGLSSTLIPKGRSKWASCGKTAKAQYTGRYTLFSCLQRVKEHQFWNQIEWLLSLGSTNFLAGKAVVSTTVKRAQKYFS